MLRLPVNTYTLEQGAIAFKRYTEAQILGEFTYKQELPFEQRLNLGAAACIELVKMGFTDFRQVVRGLTAATEMYTDEMDLFLEQIIGDNPAFYPLREVEGRIMLHPEGLRDEYPDIILPVTFENGEYYSSLTHRR